MTDLVYHLFVILFLVWGAWSGYRKGFSQMVPSCIGLAVGALCSYVFRFPVEDWITSEFPDLARGSCGEFVVSTLACSSIFLISYTAFFLITYPLALIFRNIETGLFDSVAGAIVGLLKYGVFISLFFNLFVCLFPYCRLTEYARHDDGDIVHEIMLLSPWIMGSVNIDGLQHALQLEEAGHIS